MKKQVGPDTVRACDRSGNETFAYPPDHNGPLFAGIALITVMLLLIGTFLICGLASQTTCATRPVAPAALHLEDQGST